MVSLTEILDPLLGGQGWDGLTLSGVGLCVSWGDHRHVLRLFNIHGSTLVNRGNHPQATGEGEEEGNSKSGLGDLVTSTLTAYLNLYANLSTPR